MNWPFVSRRRYDQALMQIAQARLELEVERSEVAHLKESKTKMVARLIKAAMAIKEMRSERDQWRKLFMLADEGPKIVVEGK